MSLSTPVSGYLDRQIAPLVKSGSDSIQQLAGILGPTKNNFVFSPDQVRTSETFTLQRLAEGKSDFTGFSMSSAIQDSNPAILQLFPMLKVDNITFDHFYYSFPKALAIATPAQAPPAYVEAAKRQRSVTIERYALGATTTVQELCTAEGQFVMRGKLVTVAVGFIEVMELLAINLLLTMPTMYAEYFVKAGQSQIDLQRAGRMNDLYFDIMRRRDNGFAELVDMVKQSMSQQNIEPTDLIMPEGMRSLMMASKMKQEYFRGGPTAIVNADRLGDAVGDSWNGLRFTVVASIDLQSADMMIEPLTHFTIIGDHARIDDFYTNREVENWSTKFMSIEIFSMEDDNFVPITVRDCLENDWRFSASDDNLSEWHQQLAGDLNNMIAKSGLPIYDQQYDMFIYTARDPKSGRPEWNITEVWGHMEPWALSDETIKSVATTTAKALYKATTRTLPSLMKNLKEGLADMKTMFDSTPTATDRDFLTARGEIGRYGVRQLPTNNAFPVNYVPPGYGLPAGLLEIADKAGKPGYDYIDANLAEHSKAWMSSAIEVHNFFLNIYGLSHPALNPANAPGFYLEAMDRVGIKTQSSIHIASLLNFLSNIVDKPKATLFIDLGNVNAPLPRVTPLDEDSPYFIFNRIFESFGTPALFVGAFGSAGNIAKFEKAFAASAFARKYAAYVEEQRKKPRAGMSENIEAAAALEGEEEGETALARFNRREVIDQNLAPEQAAALYGRVIQFVRANKAPKTITTAILRSYENDPSFDLRAGLQVPQTDLSATLVPSGFAISIDALRAAPDAVRDVIKLQSPLNPGSVLNIDAVTPEFDGGGVNNNLLMTTLVSAANPRSNMFANLDGRAGTRGIPEAVPTRPTPERAFGTVAGGNILPPFALSLFTDSVGSTVVTNEHITERYAKIGANVDLMLRIAAQMFILAPISRKLLRNFADNDIQQPVAWLMHRFNRRYRTATFCFISKSTLRPFGNMRYMDFDTHLGRNAINKNLMVHTSGYFGPTVEDVQDWFNALDVAVVGYDGGENTKAFTANNWDITELDSLPQDGPSLLYMMVPARSLVGKDKAPTTMDMRGCADPVNYKGTSVHRDSRFAGQPFYKSALFYNTLLGLSEIMTPTAEDWHRFHRRAGLFNTVTHQALQLIVNPHTGNHEHAILPTDPFKTSVHPGCAELRTSPLPRVYKDWPYTFVSL